MKSGLLSYYEPDNTIQYNRSPTRTHTLQSVFSSLNFERPLPNIEIVYSYAGATGELIEHIATCGKYQGLIMAGTGAGRFLVAEEKALIIARESGLHIFWSSRVGSGRCVGMHHYQKHKTNHG